MNFLKIGRINKRILELKRMLADEKRIREIATGVTIEFAQRQLENANKPLRAELDQLETERRQLQDSRSAFLSILAISISLMIAFLVPYLQNEGDQKADIQAIYQAVVANGDIYISNYDSLKNSRNKNLPPRLPEFFIESEIKPNIHKILQRKLGIDLYRYFLAYVNETELLNGEINQLRNDIITNGSISVKSKDVNTYWQGLEALESGNWETSRFNYIHDSSCIEYVFVNSFKFLDVAERDRSVNCESDSLNRIFYHYGYIEIEMPKWIRPELRMALNEREQGLGDRLIHK